MIAIDITFILFLSKQTGLGFLTGIRKYKVRGLMGLRWVGCGLGLPRASTWGHSQMEWGGGCPTHISSIRTYRGMWWNIAGKIPKVWLGRDEGGYFHMWPFWSPEGVTVTPAVSMTQRRVTMMVESRNNWNVHQRGSGEIRWYFFHRRPPCQAGLGIDLQHAKRMRKMQRRFAPTWTLMQP